MPGMSDDVGRLMTSYLRRNAARAHVLIGDDISRAHVLIGDDISRAIGRADWSLVYQLQRARRRLAGLETMQDSLVI